VANLWQRCRDNGVIVREAETAKQRQRWRSNGKESQPQWSGISAEAMAVRGKVLKADITRGVEAAAK